MSGARRHGAACTIGSAGRSRRISPARRRCAAAFASLLVLLASAPIASAGDRQGSPGRQLAETEREITEVDRRIADSRMQAEGAEARFEELSGRLDDVGQRLQVARDAERLADRAATDARSRVERAEAEVVLAEEQLRASEEVLAAVARRAYVQGRASLEPLTVTIASLEGGTREDLGDRLHYLERTVGRQANAVESAGALRQWVDGLRERAHAERVEAARMLEQAEAAANEVALVHAEVLALTDEATDELRVQRRELGEQRERRDRLVDDKERLEAAVAAEAEARAASARASQTSASGRGASSGELATVRGITVASSIAPALEMLLDAAAADGIVLGGSGYRSPEVTARLRRSNGCPDVYDSPASSCRIPTARPGTSQHELGLAVDFTWQGRTICYPNRRSRCSGNAAFDWLRLNASRFGFHNLPSEAWHWSTTGK